MGSTVTKRYRTFWARLWAGFIDGLIFLPVGIADDYLLAPERGKSTVLVWAFFSYSAYSLYSVIMHARYGQTLGKMASRVKVLDLPEASVPTLRQAFLRDSPWIVTNLAAYVYLVFLVLGDRYSPEAAITEGPAILIGVAASGWLLTELVTMLTNNKRRALHDYIAGTVVVRVGSVPEPPAADSDLTMPESHETPN